MSVYTANPNRVSTSYIRGLGLVAAKEGNEFTFYHYNAHGDVVQLTDANGNIIRDYAYDAFGVEQDADDTDANPFRYCGEQYDSETGNYYLRARYYTPGVGSFTQEDPVMDGLNWYGYCAGNPIRFVDSSGKVIRLSENATKTQKEQYEKAVEYIKTSSTGKKLVDELENSETTFTICFTDNFTGLASFNKDPRNRYDSSIHAIYWDPYAGYVFEDGMSVRSPALALAHEMGHGSQHLNGQLNGKDVPKTERNNVSKWENPIAKELGEYLRPDYYSETTLRKMNNSTEWGLIVPITYPWTPEKTYKYFFPGV